MNLFERFEVLEDPRDIRGKKYKLIDILIMTIYGLLFGLKDFVNIADYMKLNEEYFTKLLGLENGTPSHDCLSDIYAKINSKKFMEIFIEWTKDLIQKRTGKKISIDGKAVRSATDKINNGNIPYIVSAFIGELGLSIGQVKVDDKTKWKTVNALLYVKVKEKEEVIETDNYYTIDYKIDLDEAEKVVRNHWSIECGLHWKLDVILDEDHSRNREGNSINNLFILRKIIFNLASLDNSFGKITLKKKLTRYKLNYKNIERLIFDVIPSIT